MTKTLPRSLTSYDIFKTAAVLLMIVDHIGYYFYPEEFWWRVAGRACVPIWMFLVGYARSRDMGWQMWLGIALLTGGSMLAGMNLIPVTILLTIVVTRAIIDPLAQRMLLHRSQYIALMGLLFMLALPTMVLGEYGTVAVILALFGWFTRAWQDGDPRVTRDFLLLHMGAATLIYALYQQLTFAFPQAEMLVMAGGAALAMLALRYFQPAQFPGTAGGAGHILTLPLKLAGRHTLLIYVGHLLLFKAAGLYFYGERFKFLNWHWLEF